MFNTTQAVQVKKWRRIVRTITRVFGISSEDSKRTMQRVTRLKDVSEMEDPWEKRIVELADGKSIREISEILYWDELKGGAWLTDIGLWRDLFYRDVARTIGKLSRTSYIQLEPSDIT